MVGIGVSLPTAVHPLAFVYWGLWSEILMLITVAAATLDRRGRIIAALTRVIERIRAGSRTIFAALLILVGLVLIFEAIHRLGTLHLFGI